MTEKPGKPKKPSPKQNGRLKIDLAPDDALRAALETSPPEKPKKAKAVGRSRR